MTTWVLLRGLTREKAHWGSFPQRLQQGLAPDSRVIALDLPGTGTLRQQASPARIEGIAAACRAQLFALQVRAPLGLIGLSLGGMVATAWALAHPEEVGLCVVINSSMRPLAPLARRLRPQAWAPLLAALLRSDSRAIETTVHGLTSARPEPPGLLDEWVAIRQARPVSTPNALRQLLAAARFRHAGPAPRCPTLVVCSAGDALVDPACSRTLARHWGMPLLTNESAGHDLPLDAGAWLAGQLAAWCRPDALLTQARGKMPE